MNALEVFTQALHEFLRAKHEKVPLRGVTVTHVTDASGRRIVATIAFETEPGDAPRLLDDVADALGAHPHTRVRRGGRS